MQFVSNEESKHKYLKYKALALQLASELEEAERRKRLVGGEETQAKKPVACAASRTNPDTDAQMEAMSRLKDLKEEEMKLLENFRNSYDLSRFPSYCDRILARTVQIKSASDIVVDKIAYNSYTNTTIAKSDHDLVYAVYNINYEDIDVSVLALTWNQNGKSPKYQNVLDPDFYRKMNIEGVTDHKSFDIIVLSQQETPNSDSFFGLFEGDDTLQKSLVAFGKREKMVARTARSGMGNFYVRLTVLLTEELNKKVIAVKKASECLNGELCTKSISGIGLTFKTSQPYLSVNFFSAHMPINVKKEDLGVDARVKAYQKIDKFMEKKFTAQTSSNLNQVDFILGDLNFRYNTGSAGDQLTQLMDEKKVFRDFDEGIEINFPPTCKRSVCK